MFQEGNLQLSQIEMSQFLNLKIHLSQRHESQRQLSSYVYTISKFFLIQIDPLFWPIKPIITGALQICQCQNHQ
jgi:hypothetical protein